MPMKANNPFGIKESKQFEVIEEVRPVLRKQTIMNNPFGKEEKKDDVKEESNVGKKMTWKEKKELKKE